MDDHKWAYYVWEKYRCESVHNPPFTLVHLDRHWDGVDDFTNNPSEHTAPLDRATNISQIVEQIVKPRSRWTATRKVEVVLAVLKRADVSEVCRKNGISSQAYAWRDSFLEGGQESLKSRRGHKDLKEREVSRLERKVGHLTLQLEILEEVARLKKTKRLP